MLNNFDFYTANLKAIITISIMLIAFAVVMFAIGFYQRSLDKKKKK